MGGIILCGGHSRRMGQPKAWLPWGKEFLLSSMVRRLSTMVQPVVVVAAAGQALPPLPPETLLVCDRQPDEGPLRGLATGLEVFLAEEIVYATACDAPFLRPDFVRTLWNCLADFDAVVPQIANRWYPLSAVYRVGVLPIVELLLGQGVRRMQDLLAALKVRPVTEAECRAVDPDLLSLRNLNSPEDYADALLLGETSGTEAG